MHPAKRGTLKRDFAIMAGSVTVMATLLTFASAYNDRDHARTLGDDMARVRREMAVEFAFVQKAEPGTCYYLNPVQTRAVTFEVFNVDPYRHGLNRLTSAFSQTVRDRIETTYNLGRYPGWKYASCDILKDDIRLTPAEMTEKFDAMTRAVEKSATDQGIKPEAKGFPVLPWQWR